MQRPSIVMAASGFCFALSVVTAAHPAVAGGKKYGNGDDCIPKVQVWLKQGGVDLASVDSIKIDAQIRRNNQGDKLFRGWQGWVRFKDRDGAVVFSMRGNCDLVGSWTKGDIEWLGPGAT